MKTLVTVIFGLFLTLGFAYAAESKSDIRDNVLLFEMGDLHDDIASGYAIDKEDYIQQKIDQATGFGSDMTK